MSTAIEKAGPASVVGGVEIDYEAVLKSLNLNPRDPKVQALVLMCQQYSLDPVLKHAQIINGDVYVTHKGLLHVAHESKRLNGIVLVDEGETRDEWWARVSVYVKGMEHPFTYKGRYSKGSSNKKFGPEMAITRAECLALRRAFDISAPVQEEQDWVSAPAAESNGPTPTIVTTVMEVTATPPLADDSEPLDEEFDRKPIGEVLTRLDDEGKSLAREALRGLPNWQSPQLTKAQALEFQARLGRVEGEMAIQYDNRRKMVFAKLGELGFKKDDEPLRHAIVRQATGGRTDSTSALTAAECDTVVAVAEEVAAGGWATSVNDDGEMSLVAIEPEDEGRPFDEEPAQ